MGAPRCWRLVLAHASRGDAADMDRALRTKPDVSMEFPGYGMLLLDVASTGKWMCLTGMKDGHMRLRQSQLETYRKWIGKGC